MNQNIICVEKDGKTTSAEYWREIDYARYCILSNENQIGFSFKIS